MSSNDDEAGFEERIRGGLADRDPGPAPARLRDRVGAVTSAVRPRGSRIHRFIAVTRPAVAATVTLAAVLLGVLIVAVVRPGARGQGFPAPSAGPGGPTPGPDLATVRDPLALSLGWMVFTALLALLVAWAAVEVYLRTPGAASIRLRRLDRKRARGLVVLAVATPILIFSQVMRTEVSLVAGGLFQASLVHLEGMGALAGSGAAGDGQAAYFRYVPGGTVTALQAIRNAGRFPVTIMGATEAQAGIELRLLARHDPAAAIDVDSTPTYPLVPLELAPGEEREIVVVVHFGACPGVPIPSPEPSPDLSGDFVPPSLGSSAYEAFDVVPLRYSVLGLAREVDVPLFATLLVRSSSGTICGTDPDWASPSPSPR